ncbi:zinc finger homeobox protein 4-like isoform X2 [Lineus longissimus]|uniref:zinc finger homeobox protein 4-like isoform X2 n=1 Tax=Lineus longissimus TaxID=88925 RepID=UPI00315D2728
MAAQDASGAVVECLRNMVDTLNNSGPPSIGNNDSVTNLENSPNQAYKELHGAKTDSNTNFLNLCNNVETSAIANDSLQESDRNTQRLSPAVTTNCEKINAMSFNSIETKECAQKEAENCENEESMEVDRQESEEDDMLSDVESFDGKIVYNPDGSAYIIEGADSDLSDGESLLDVPQVEGSIIEQKGKVIPTSQIPVYPQIANAFYVSKNPAFYNHFYMLSEQKSYPEAPIMHSYRVYDLRSGKKNTEAKSDHDMKPDCSDLNDSGVRDLAGKSPSRNLHMDTQTVPTKPILMCFICKLSFGYAKSFVAHAIGEHSMVLNEEEKQIMSGKNASAIIQALGKEKDPLLSFLEPNLPNCTKSSHSPKSGTPRSTFPSSSIAQSNTNVSFVHTTKPTPVEHQSKAAMSSQVSSNDVSSIVASSESINHKMDASDSERDEPPSGNVTPTSEMDDSNLDSDVIKNNNNLPDLTSSNDLGFPYSTGSMISRSSPKDFSLSSINSSNVTLPLHFGGQIPSPLQAHLASMMPQTCEDHPQGKAQGVECPKCDMILSSSRSLGGHMTMMHSRNSCKTLKCPKCNWHYKYQETLEIHMKEKHPDSDTQCIYCITHQPHPRLARGEAYTCGYKPYRCDVCNYSTTTKGNLSIHMQSDKHINNIQELQNGTSEIKLPPQQHAPQPAPTPDPNAAAKNKQLKPKPTWRCDVCNYETNVARNLRIHMTSEKHTHNMMVLQQNVKHMQRDMQMQLALYGGQDTAMMGIPSPLTPALPPFPYDQSMFMPQVPGNVDTNSPVDLTMAMDQAQAPANGTEDEPSKIFQCSVCNVFSTDSLEALHQHMQVDRTKSKPDDNVMVASGNYMCQLCSYKTNLKANFQLHCKTDKHLQRLQLVNHIKEGGTSNEWRLKYMNMSNPIQVKCNACDYYTNSIHKLQMHAANPRHEPSSQLFRHLLNGEISIKSERKYYHCSLCSYSTKAKLNLIQHVRTMKHMRNESVRQIQQHEAGKSPENDRMWCFSVKEFNESDNIEFEDGDGEHNDEESNGPNSLENSMSEVPLPGSMHAANMNNSSPENSDGVEAGNSEHIHICPYCNYSSVNEMRIQAHITTQHSQPATAEMNCPLCQDGFKEKAKLERHLAQSHNVSQEGVQRLMILVDHTRWSPPAPAEASGAPTDLRMNQNESQDRSPTGTPEDDSMETKSDASEPDAIKIPQDDADSSDELNGDKDEEEYRCHTCSGLFRNIDALYAHQNELGHLELKQTPRGPGYLCWKKGCNQYFKTASALQVHFREIHTRKQHLSVSKRHVYKYRCNQCSLAFKTLEKLQTHSQYHMIRAATRCTVCDRSFRTLEAMKKHVESTHLEMMSEEEVANYKLSLLSNPLALLGSTIENVINQENHDEEMREDVQDMSMSDKMADYDGDRQSPMSDDQTNDSINNDGENDDGSEGSYREKNFFEDYINSQAIAEDSYNDPARKFKCHRCKVAFTKQNYLTAHNKTLLHRKGDKMNYPIEKYLDPNRPYKCDVCKESFTQKNILLVHYNSVSHLHKLKQAAQSTSQSPSPTAAVSPISTPASTSPVSTPSAQPPSTSPGAPATSNSGNSDQKPFKCNICKVAYSQGSTLDIHMRSVLHQTRASKLQELAMTGQVDLTQPLVEQPEKTPQAQSAQNQHKKLLAEMLQQKHLPLNLSMSSPITNPPGIFATNISPVISQPPTSTTPTSRSVSPATTPTPTSSQSSNQPMFSCQRCNSIFVNAEALGQHQAMYCYFQPPQMLMTPGGSAQNQFSAMRRSGYIPRFKPQVHKNLLENFGFECVMHFNENNQVVKPKKEGDKTEEKVDIKKELNIKVADNMPEIEKAVCDRCGKSFSSIWVLKEHQEEIHKDVIPIDFIELYGESFKEDFERRQPPMLVIGPEGLPTTSTPAQATPPMPSAPSTPNSDINVKIEPSSAPPCSLSLDLPPVTGVTMLNMMQMSMPMGMPVSMGMQPPLVPMMLPTMENPFTSGGVLPSFMDPNLQQKIQQQQQQAAAAANNQKRARTRINDEQLKILRAHFDINNSPSEEQIIEMSEKSGLPQKVIKHWFRNTLFKERQRNKDSPYNFNNPPSTTLNLEEYEKTGKISTSTSDTNSEPDLTKPINMIHDDLPLPPPRPEPVDIKPDLKHLERKLNIKQEPVEEPRSKFEEQIRESLKEKVPPPVLMSPGLAFPVATSADFLNITPPASSSSMLMTTPPSTILPPIPSTSASSCKRSDSMDSSLSSLDLTPAQIAANAASNRRANRTRFTDFQIKTLQEYFEQNAYPKDDDLEHLSKVLNLSPRVIVVWFQNARQKARKVYENQPPAESPSEDSSGRFQRTPGLNYQCKKCLTVFQRYYELIKHQKKHCFKDEDIAPSQVFGGDDSNSSSVNYSVSDTNVSERGASENSDPPITTTVENLRLPPSESPSALANFKCDKCTLTFPRFDLWQEHQNVHIMNPSLFQSFAPDSAFGVLQNLAQQQAAAEQDKSPSKRKMSEVEDEDDNDQPRDKRLRTTILPEQLDYLYQKYQVDCNPSRKQLENIASEVGLKKRVVQVWFQNTRARERKGQYRAHQQLIHKRCPFCRALFRAKSALESHLATKHPEEMAKGEINIDSIPDAPGESPSPLTPTSTSPGLDMAKLMANPFNMQPFMPFMPTPNLGLPPTSEPLHMQMKRMYEDSLRQYMDDLGQKPNSSDIPSTTTKKPSMPKPSAMSKSHQDDDAPLDLSNPVKVSVSRDNRRYSYDGPATDVSSNRSFDHFNNSRISFDDSISETHSESTENDYEDSNPASPNGAHRSPSSHQQKRYRTQMTNLQVKVMKTLFVDYKTPTMAECEMLGREIGLAKRVIQVWFQNARAKEKKAKASNYGNQYTNEVELPPQPDECRYCNFNYSHKYSIQDHIFTKKHIDNVKKSLHTQLENERETSEPGNNVNRSQESERLQEVNMATHPHLAQLQAMGLQAMGLPANLGVVPGMPASAIAPGSSAFTEALSKEAQKSRSRSKVKVKDEQKEDIVKKKESTSVSEAAITPQMLSPFGPLFPGSEAGLLPFMYPGGMPGFYPGMGMPFMQPGLIPGAEGVFSYDPTTFGTPLTLLQIPQEAIRAVTAKLNDPNCTVASYTQDCKTLNDLKSMVSAANLALVTETNVDVGFICKKCHMVYPAKDACLNHQRMMCFAGKSTNDQKQVLKLEQAQYHCGLCNDGFSILQEYKQHCDTDGHKTKMATIGLQTHAKSSDMKMKKPSVARS